MLVPAALVVALGLMGLLGWLIDSSTLKHLSPNDAEMKANTAIGLTLAGISLLLLQTGRARPLAHVLAAIVAALGLVTLAEYAFGWNAGLDQLLFHDASMPAGMRPGRMGVNTATCMLLSGLSLVWLDKQWGRFRPAQAGALLVATLAEIAALGYLFDVSALSRGFVSRNVTPMALDTAAALLLLALGLLIARPSAGVMALVRSEGAGGALVRRMLPPLVVIPVAVGWLRLEGQRAGLYGTAEGGALYATSMIVLFAVLIWHVARSLERIDVERRESAALAREVVESSLDCIVAVDQDGQIVDFNPAAEMTFGYRKDEVIGKDIGELLIPIELRDWYRSGLDLYAETGEAPILGHRLELTALRSDGSEFPIELSMSRLKRPGPAIFVGHVQDISERRRADLTVRRLAAVVESAEDAIMAVDLDGTFVAWNPAAERMYGYSAAEVEGKPASILVHPEQLEEQGELHARLRRGESIERHDTVRFHKDGTPVEVSLTGFPVRGAGGDPVGCAVILRDAREQRRLEEELRQAQKMEAIGRLAGGVAHDFNNLLTIITGHSALLLEELGRDHPHRRGVEQIGVAADKAASLTARLLTFSRRQAREQQLVDLNVLVSNVAPMLERLLGEDIELTTELSSDTVAVNADPNQIDQVIFNLAVNSRDAMPKGGRLAITTAIVELGEGYKDRHSATPIEPGRYAMLAVSDSGTGMDAETQARIFEPFFTTKEPDKGTGLGLSTVYGIAAQSEGFVWCYSEPGYGTTFKVYFPQVGIDAGTVVPAGEAPPAEAAPSLAAAVLLIEDDEGVRRLVRRVLENQGCSVLEAANGRDALNISEQYPSEIRLVVTDLVLPGMNGLEIGDRLLAARPDLKLLCMSGYQERGVGDLSRFGDAAAYIEKPFNPVVLANKVRDLLDAA